MDVIGSYYWIAWFGKVTSKREVVTICLHVLFGLPPESVYSFLIFFHVPIRSYSDRYNMELGSLTSG